MTSADRTSLKRFWISLIALVAIVVVPSRTARPSDETDQDAAPATIEIDVLAVFESGNIRTEQVSGDPVWRLQPEDEDDQLVQIPLIFKPGDGPLDVKASTIKMRGGKLLAYRFDNSEQATTGDGRRSPRGLGRFPGGAGPGLGRGPAGFGPPGPGGFGGFGRPPRRPNASRQRTETRSRTGEDQTEAIVDPELQMPLLARRFTVTPDGSVQWKLDRIPRGEVIETESLYALKLDSDLLELKLNPEKAQSRTSARQSRSKRRTESRRSNSRSKSRQSSRQRQTRRSGSGGFRDGGIPGGGPGGISSDRRRGRTRRSARDSAEITRLTPAERRAQLDRSRELKKRLRDLPTKFETPLPRRVWAIFETNTDQTKLEIQGLTPGVWSIGFDQIDGMNDLNSGVRGGFDQGLPYDVSQRIRSLQAFVARQDHPYNFRMIAYAIRKAQLSQHAQPGDSLFSLCESIIHGPDAEARRVMIEDLVSTIPLTPAAYSLLKRAKDLEPMAKLMLLRGLLQVDVTDPHQSQELLATINHTLVDPAGPEPGEVLREVLESVEGRGDAVMLLVGGIRFDLLQDRRRDGAIAFILENAGTDPLAAAWLDHHLIGSTQPHLVERTLDLINEAGSLSMRPTVNRLLNFVLGPPSSQANVEPALHANITQPLLIDSPGHSMIRVLQHADPNLRRMAWKALPRFSFGGVERRGSRRSPARGRRGGRRGRGAPQAAEIEDSYTILVEAGLSQAPHPPELVRFLIAQPDQDRVAESLVLIVLEGDRHVATPAARALLGSGQPLDRTVGELSYEDRGNFARGLYQALENRQPLVTGLLQQPDDRNPLVSWFCDSVSAGGLPEASFWMGAFGEEEQLMELMTSSDEVIALAAIAALVADAGGDETTAHELAKQLHSDDKSNPTALWSKARQEIYLKRLQEAAGTYRLLVKVYGTAVVTEPRRGRRGRAPRSNARSEARRQQGAAPRGPQRGPPGMPDGMPGGPGFGPGGPGGFGGPGGPGGFGRGFEGGAFGRGPSGGTQEPLPTGKPDLLIELGVVSLEADGKSVRLANDTLALSVAQDRLALRIDKPGELKNFPDDAMAQLPLESVTNPIDLTSYPDGSWQGLVELPDSRKTVITLEPVNDE